MNSTGSSEATPTNINEELTRLVREHRDLESRLEALDSEVYLTPDEQLERKRIQKLKLKKKDRIHQLKRTLS